MAVFLTILYLALLAVLVALLLKNMRLTRYAAQRKAESDYATQQVDQVRKRCDEEVERIRGEAKNGVVAARKLVDQQVAELRAETQRVRQHYEAEARKATDATREELAKARREADEFRKYAPLRDAETEVRHRLAEALSEATKLRDQAQALLEQARTASEGERVRATEKAKVAYEEADARLNQATRDAGRLIAEAEAKAKQIAGEAYDALRDKQLLEQAASAMRNIIEGYGDRYLRPTHSLLDDLAAEFGYTSAGESLKSVRAQSRRMVEQGEAAGCDYAETNRKETAVRFVIDAFNGRVDAILSRVKHDNYGTLEQEIRDAFSLVNLHGKAFRNARILPAYLDTRLEELKWAVVVQELARRQVEEQRELKARLRDEEKARKEHEAQMRQAAREEELKKRAAEEKEREIAAARKAVEEKERELAAAQLSSERTAAAEQKAQLEQRLAEMQQAYQGIQQDLAAATEKKLTIAQQTKKGHVYIISNVGAFGEGIYKIGLTRRLNRQERIDELGDASVPFDFDVHGWIESDNAPALEHRLQKAFLRMQVNKVNSRKEFFRVTLKDIREEVDRLGTDERFTVIHWTELAAATQYRESRDIESDPEKLDKWLKRQEALADREIRLDSVRLQAAEVSEPAAVTTEEAGSAPAAAAAEAGA